MWKKALAILSIMLNFFLFGCTSKAIQTDDGDNIAREQLTSYESDSNINSTSESTYSDILLNKVSTEKVSRKIEGINEDVKVNHYEIFPYNISFQLDDMFGVPEIEQNKFIYSVQNGKYKITLEVFEETNIDNVITQLQKSFKNENFDEKSDLENLPIEENDLVGKSQFIYDPVKGFYVYEIANNVLAITYQYPSEGGDGMTPLLKSLRQSIQVKNNVY